MIYRVTRPSGHRRAVFAPKRPLRLEAYGTNMQTALAMAGLARPAGSRKLWLLRGSVFLVAALGVFGAVWLSPWLAVGMTWSDFNARTTVGLLLVGGFSGAAIAVILVWAPLLTEEPKSELLRVLLGEGLWVRGRGRFLNRLSHQCQRCQRDRGMTFSLAIIEIADMRRGAPASEAVIATALATVRETIRAKDVVGDSEAAELWVLLIDAHSEGRAKTSARITEGLRERLVASLGDDAPRLTVGGSTFGADGRDPDALFRAARTRALGARPDVRVA